MKKIIKDWLPYVIVIILVLLIKKYVVSPIRVNGKSMDNTLKAGDIMILNSLEYRFNDIKRFDIVVIDAGSEYFIKRVIGLPGEEIEYKDNVLYVNGKKVKDKFASKTDDFKVKVKKGTYFVMGDNRPYSRDSRYFGAFKKSKIVGKTSLTVFPFKRFGNKK